MHRFCRLAFRRSRWSLAFVWVGIFFAVSIPSAYSAQWEATVVPSKKRIKGYRIITNRTRVRTKGVDENRQAFVRIRGYFKRRGWGVYRNRKWILPKDSKKRSFSFRVPVKGELTEVNLRLVSPRNKARRTRILIEFPDWIPFIEGEELPRKKKVVKKRKKKRRKRSKKKQWSFALSGGGTIVDYKETGVSDFDMTAVTVKGGATYHVEPNKWDVGASGYFTALPVQSNRTFDVRFLGLNARVGYRIPILDDPWKFRILGGWYYTTMLLSAPTQDDEFGYENMHGPQILPHISYSFPPGNSIYAYVKFAPIAGLGFTNREIAGGTGYIHPLSDSVGMSFSVDAADASFTVTAKNGDQIPIKSTTLSGSIGIVF